MKIGLICFLMCACVKNIFFLSTKISFSLRLLESQIQNLLTGILCIQFHYNSYLLYRNIEKYEQFRVSVKSFT